jgi:hypothetical protein
MRRLQALALLSVTAAAGSRPAHAQWWERGEGPGSLVGVSVEVEGRMTPLYPAPDGYRWYLEARPERRYAVVLTNRTRERLGVVLTVDGLNAISGQVDAGRGRMYVLGPWEETTVLGWRSSLAEVRQFTFVDERASYAARSGKANGRMGWIEVTAFREQRALAGPPCRGWPPRCGEGPIDRRMRPEARGSEPDEERAEAAREEERRTADAPAASSPSAEGAAKARDDKGESRSADLYRPAPTPAPGTGSFPGTGWGERAYDPVTIVDFRPEASPAERVTLRYEYASALRALGILPRPRPGRDRLGERERGELGFARPPLY